MKFPLATPRTAFVAITLGCSVNTIAGQESKLEVRIGSKKIEPARPRAQPMGIDEPDPQEPDMKPRPAPRNLPEYLRILEAIGELARVRAPVDPLLEVTEIASSSMYGPQASTCSVYAFSTLSEALAFTHLESDSWTIAKSASSGPTTRSVCPLPARSSTQ